MPAIVSASRALSVLLAASSASAALLATHATLAPTEPAQVVLRLIASSDGQPVSDLQASDIEVLDNGVAQPAATVEYVDMVTGDSPEPPGDFALVLDDLGTPRSGTAGAIAVGLGLVDALGPDDRLAVVNTGPFPLSHPRSTDRASARSIIRQFIGQRVTTSSLTRAEACRRSVVSLTVIDQALKTMAQQPGSRRAMLVASDGQRSFWGEGRHEKCSEARRLFDRVIATSSVADVPIYAVDVPGQPTSAVPNSATARTAAADARSTTRRPSDASRGSLALLAGLTGGTFSAAPEGLEDGVHQMVRDSRQYYRVVCRQPAMPRGERNELRRIHVRVHRPGVEVRARERYLPDASRRSPGPG